jgi:membrane protease YdiL (CAAX protease family)
VRCLKESPRRGIKLPSYNNILLVTDASPVHGESVQDESVTNSADSFYLTPFVPLSMKWRGGRGRLELTKNKKTLMESKNKRVTLILLLFLLVGWPLLSYVIMSAGSAGGESKREIGFEGMDPISQIYLPTIIIEWLIFLLVLLVLKRGKENLSTVGFSKFTLANLGIGLGFLLAANVILFGLGSILQFFHITMSKEVIFMLPRTKTEKIFWAILSITAGICEETGFRGYVLTKLNLFFNNWYLTVALSSLSFGVGHFYQGIGGIILTGIYGLLFCLLFIWRKSLIPGIFAHFLQDLTALFALSRF